MITAVLQLKNHMRILVLAPALVLLCGCGDHKNDVSPSIAEKEVFGGNGQLKDTLDSEWEKVKSSNDVAGQMNIFCKSLEKHLRVGLPSNSKTRLLGFERDKKTNEISSPFPFFRNWRTDSNLWKSKSYSIEKKANKLSLIVDSLEIPLNGVDSEDREFSVGGLLINPTLIACAKNESTDAGAFIVLYGYEYDPVAAISYSKDGTMNWSTIIYQYRGPALEGSFWLSADCEVRHTELGVIVFHSELTETNIYCLDAKTGKTKLHFSFETTYHL